MAHHFFVLMTLQILLNSQYKSLLAPIPCEFRLKTPEVLVQ